tara:strand:+ start:68 stop:772 length:705 start_codon:yes stop_codon:yes gene_type:complete
MNKYIFIFFLSFNPFINANETVDIFTDSENSTYLACAAAKGGWGEKSGKYSIDGLLNKTLKFEISKKNKRMIKKLFKYDLFYQENAVLNGNKTLDLVKLYKDFQFILLRISKNDNQVKICIKNVGYAYKGECNNFTTSVDKYVYEKKTGGAYITHDRYTLLREDLRFQEFSDLIGFPNSRAVAQAYQCSKISKDSIKKLDINHKYYSSPFNAEYKNYVDQINEDNSTKEKKNQI